MLGVKIKKSGLPWRKYSPVERRLAVPKPKTNYIEKRPIKVVVIGAQFNSKSQFITFGAGWGTFRPNYTKHQPEERNPLSPTEKSFRKSHTLVRCCIARPVNNAFSYVEARWSTSLAYIILLCESMRAFIWPSRINCINSSSSDATDVLNAAAIRRISADK